MALIRVREPAAAPAQSQRGHEVPIALIQSIQAVVVALIAAGGTYVVTKAKDKDAPVSVQRAQADEEKLKKLTAQLEEVQAERGKLSAMVAEVSEANKQLAAKLAEAGRPPAFHVVSSQIYMAKDFSPQRCKAKAKAAMSKRGGTTYYESDTLFSFIPKNSATPIVVFCHDVAGRGTVMAIGAIDESARDTASAVLLDVYKEDKE